MLPTLAGEVLTTGPPKPLSWFLLRLEWALTSALSCQPQLKAALSRAPDLRL